MSEFSDVVKTLCVHPSKVRVYMSDLYRDSHGKLIPEEAIGDVKKRRNGYSVEIPYDNGIFRLWYDGHYNSGSITYQNWQRGIVTIAEFGGVGFEKNKGKHNYASIRYIKYEGIDQTQHNFLESVAERVKKRLEAKESE